MVTTKKKQSHFKRSPPPPSYHPHHHLSTHLHNHIELDAKRLSGHSGPFGAHPPRSGQKPERPFAEHLLLPDLNRPHSSLIALHASDLPVAAKPKLPVAVSSQPGSISSSQEFTFSAFVAFSDSIATVSPWPHAISAQLFLQVR